MNRLHAGMNRHTENDNRNFSDMEEQYLAEVKALRAELRLQREINRKLVDRNRELVRGKKDAERMAAEVIREIGGIPARTPNDHLGARDA